MPPLYLVVIAALLYLQFGRPDTRQERLAGIDVTTAVERSLGGRERIRRLGIRYEGLRMEFTPRHSATIRDSSGTVERLRPSSYRLADGGLTVLFGERVQLRFEGHGGRLELDAAALDSLPLPVELTLPASLEARASATISTGLPLLSIPGPSCTQYLAGADGVRFAEGSVTVILKGRLQTPVLTVDPCSPVADPYLYWFGRGGSDGDEASYAAAVERYLSRSFTGWQTEVYGGQADLVGSRELTRAFLAESVTRGTYAQAVATVRRRVSELLSRGAEPADPSPAAYLGLSLTYVASSSSTVSRSLGELGRGANMEPAVFETPHLYVQALDHGAPGLVDRLTSYAATLATRAGDPSVHLGIARFTADAAAYQGQSAELRSRLRTLVTDRIIPYISRTEKGLFFYPSPESGIELERTIRVGRLLIDSAALLERESLAAVGRLCIQSALALAASDGSLPARIRFDGGKLIPSAEMLEPERIYELVAVDRYLARERPLAREVAAGAWLLTAAHIQEIAGQESGLSLRFSFPVGQAHHLVIAGIPLVTELRLHRVAWRQDPEHERYSDGWWYDTGTRTLYVKCTQREQTEELVLTFP